LSKIHSFRLLFRRFYSLGIRWIPNQNKL